MEIKSVLTGIQTYKQTEIEKNKSSQAGKQNTSTTGDKVTFSSRAKLFQEGLKVAKQSPDVRQEKIEELKDKIQTGKYQIDEQKIARKMLQEDIDIWL
jgi:negative regulator of flagellin synthesis FlgM